MMHCVGCGGKISWDGSGMFSYTCPCDATIFADDTTGRIAIPSSLVLQLHKGEAITHLDDLVGVSDYQSPEKEQLINELRSRGFTWMEECEQCRRDGTLRRYQQHRELNEALKQSMARFRLGELTLEESIEEMTATRKRFEAGG